MSEAGIHRPHVSGIHGRDGDGAYSIVLAGGYEDDLVSKQTTDQKYPGLKPLTLESNQELTSP